jgi:hypothetical protein
MSCTVKAVGRVTSEVCFRKDNQDWRWWEVFHGATVLYPVLEVTVGNLNLDFPPGYGERAPGATESLVGWTVELEGTLDRGGQLVSVSARLVKP